MMCGLRFLCSSTASTLLRCSQSRCLALLPMIYAEDSSYDTMDRIMKPKPFSLIRTTIFITGGLEYVISNLVKTNPSFDYLPVNGILSHNCFVFDRLLPLFACTLLVSILQVFPTLATPSINDAKTRGVLGAFVRGFRQRSGLDKHISGGKGSSGCNQPHEGEKPSKAFRPEVEFD